MQQSTPSRFLPIRSLLALSIIALAQTPASAETPSLSQILKKLQACRDIVENLRIETVWEEFEGGEPSAWEEGYICRDKSGRICVRYSHGRGALGTGEKLVVDDTFNGKVTVRFSKDPTRNHLGEPLEPGEKPNPGDCHRSAFIYDGVFPKKGGLTSHRNPYGCMDVPLIRDLSGLLENGKAIAVEAVESEKGVYELRYRLDPKDDPHNLEHRVRIDVGKGWVVTRHEQFFPNGKSARLKTCEYKQDARGRWVPTKGRFMNLWGSDVPDLDWRFKVNRIVVNDPEFDESVFDVTLKPGTYVSDIRYDDSYWVLRDTTIERPATKE